MSEKALVTITYSAQLFYINFELKQPGLKISDGELEEEHCCYEYIQKDHLASHSNSRPPTNPGPPPHTEPLFSSRYTAGCH